MMLFPEKRNTTAKGPKMRWDCDNKYDVDGGICLLLFLLRAF